MVGTGTRGRPDLRPRPARRERGNRKVTLLAAALCLALVAGGCGGGTGSASAPPASGSLDLKGVCPDPVVVQTSWFPQSEHGSVYQLVGPGYKIDAGHKRVTGPLLVRGRSTGVNIQVRAGGPAVGFQSSAALMYQDPSLRMLRSL